MFRYYSYTIIRERINLCLLKSQLLKRMTNFMSEVHLEGKVNWWELGILNYSYAFFSI